MNYLYSGSLSGVNRGGNLPGFSWGKSGGGGGGGHHRSENHQSCTPVPMVTAVPIVLQRDENSIPWGFRLQGGNDYKLQLSVKQTQSGTPAHHHLHSGDAILSINGKNTRDLTHTEATDVIKNSRTTLNLIVIKNEDHSAIDRNSGK